MTEAAADRVQLIERVTAAALKAVAGRPDVVVAFAPGGEGRVNDGVARLPAPSAAASPAEVSSLRGTADGTALKLLHHDETIHRRFRPRGREATAAFEALEQVRVETIGSPGLAGVASNLEACLEARCRGFERFETREAAPPAEAMALVLRERLTGRPPPAAAAHVTALWRTWLEERGANYLERLDRSVADQQTFAETASAMIESLGLAGAETGPEEEAGAETPEQDSHEPGSDADRSEESGAQTETGARIDENPRPSEGEPAGPPVRVPQRGESSVSRVDYKAYTTADDEEVGAETLCPPAELLRLRSNLDRRLSRLQTTVNRLANRLQRRLLAKQTRHWEFDLDEGILDSARLGRVIIDPLHPLSFKAEAETDFRDTVVSLLIDNSGSMRGRPITMAAMSADILARTLERCGVRVEILGFTTRAWKGGSAREQWLADGEPANPGRLNALRHIVYKSADQPWRRARCNLGLMLLDGLLKENIDGEALVWAHNRLLGRTERRRILMVISDGVPRDDATLSSNPTMYLENHLRDVIDWIETCSPVELTAIGIGHDVTRYYERAVIIPDIAELGDVMLSELSGLFEQPEQRKRPKGRAGRIH